MAPSYEIISGCIMYVEDEIEEFFLEKARFTPRDVERRHPSLTRHELSRRRALGLPPRFEVVSGCVMYPHREIESLLIEAERETKPARRTIHPQAATAIIESGHDNVRIN